MYMYMCTMYAYIYIYTHVAVGRVGGRSADMLVLRATRQVMCADSCCENRHRQATLKM